MKHPEKVSKHIINWINTYLENSKIEYLYAKNIEFLETEPQQHFDEIHIFKAPIIIGERGIPVIEGKSLKKISKKLIETMKFDNNLYFKYKIA